MKLVWKFVLVFVLLSAKYNEAPAQKQVWSIRTQDSVVMDPRFPMIARYPLPDVYLKWLHGVEACAGVSMPDAMLKDIQFVEVNAPDFKINGDKAGDYPSISVAVVNEGVLFISAGHMYNSRTVSHELLHFILYYMFGDKYANKHPPEYFDKCHLYSLEERMAEEQSK